MKRLFILLTLMMCAAISRAQLAENTIAPDFTVKDLSGNTYNLYAVLNSGKTVYLDIMATWCPPCWTIHQSGVLEQLYKYHGPAGATGVDPSTTDDVMVFMIEMEGSNTHAQLSGPAYNGGGNSTNTEGDWLTGTYYPIIDSNAAWVSAFFSKWHIVGYPTLYAICRDHLVHNISSNQMSQLYNLALAECPSYPPATTGIDAKIVPYDGALSFVCGPTPNIKFQNYSTSSPITSATINVYSGSTKVSSYNWTGNLLPYDIASVTIPTFYPTQYKPYRHEIVANGDGYAGNNFSADSLYKVYNGVNAVKLPWAENFDGRADIPERYSYPVPPIQSYASVMDSNYRGNVIGVTGSKTRALALNTHLSQSASYNVFDLGTFDLGVSQPYAFEADYCYKPYNPMMGDSITCMEVQALRDCDSTWETVWSRNEQALQIATTTPLYSPKAATDWQHLFTQITHLASNHTALRIVTGNIHASNYNTIWLDNLKISNTIGVKGMRQEQGPHVYPNPANSYVVVNTPEAGNALLLSMTGKLVLESKLNKSENKLSIARLPPGVYWLRVYTEHFEPQTFKIEKL